MQRRRTAVIAIVLTVVGVGFLIGSKADLGGATRLPAARKALGFEVKLLECRRLPDGRVELHLSVAGTGSALPSSEVHVGEAVVSCGKARGGLYELETRAETCGPTEVKEGFVFSEPVGSADVSLPIHIHRPDKWIAFRFDSVTTASLPLTQTVGGHSITLVRAFDSCTPRNPPWTELEIYSNASPFFGLQVRTALPQDFEQDDDQERLKDSQGQTIPLSMVYAQMVTASGRTQEGLDSSASTTALHTRPNGNFIYAYPQARKPKGKFTLVISGRLPADEKDTAVVEFKNVPVR